MSIFKIPVNKLKPSELIHMDLEYELEAINQFEVEGGDNGILLVFRTDNDCEIEILGGDSVLGGASRVVPVYYEGSNFLYLESGRHLIHKEDGSKVIQFNCDSAGVYCNVVQLI